MPDMPVFSLADEIANTCQFCATIARANLQYFFERGLVPRHTDATATVTFISFEGRTYAVTASHVVSTFVRLATDERTGSEPYFVPQAQGTIIQPPFITPLGVYPDAAPDVALAPIPNDLPRRVGKEAFVLRPDVHPTFPVRYAVAVGFPTVAKAERQAAGGLQLAMTCVHAVAEGLPAPEYADQVQFYSEIERAPDVVSLSGMSGGPVFWSDGEQIGLLGFIKEALDVVPPAGNGPVQSPPRVNFITQRASYDTFRHWANYAQREWPKQRHALNAAAQD
jgi:hypothetical protein